MIRIEDLKPPKGAVKSRRRVGRGESSGWGRTSGRGNKGALSRSGTSKRAWFEGGQMPISRRVPKIGFSNYPFRKIYNVVNIRDLAHLEGESEITPELLRKKKIVKKSGPIKLLADGEIRNPFKIKLHKASKSAIEKIVAVGGTFEEIA